MVHVRREFVELAKGKTAPIAEEALRRIAALYAVEAEVRGKPPDVRRAVRQAKSRPLVEDLFAWLEAQLARLPGRRPTAEAIRYALNHREGLERFLDDGRIELDTNMVERAIRPLVLSRKNALFASGDDGGATMGGRGLAGRDVQAERRRSAALLQRPADAPRQRLAAEPHRRADALALGRREKRLIVKRPGEGSESAAYERAAAAPAARSCSGVQFGRKSERLPDEQLQFAFEEIEASLAGNEAEAEKRSPELRHKHAEAAPGRPRPAAGAPAARRAGAGARGHRLPLLPGRDGRRSASTRRSGST